MLKGSLIVTVGISGSGKSTFAKEKFDEAPLTTVIINRDKLRELLFGYTDGTVGKYYQREDLNKLEKIVTQYEDTLIYESLEAGKLVIVDATHLEMKYLKRFEYWNVLITYVYFDISLDDAIDRDDNRPRYVGEAVITKQFHKYKSLINNNPPLLFCPATLELDPKLPSAYIIDIDGCLAHQNGKRGPFDWSLVGLDDCDEAVKIMCNALDEHVNVIICSGRDAVCTEETADWLYDKHIGYDDLHMRPEGDYRPDWVVKEEMWREIAKEYNILACIDDRMQVVRRGRALGLKMIQVDYNNF